MAEMTGLGYSDTPIIPDSTWHVHDGERPQPRVVTPGTCGKPPSDAIMLFDGSSLSDWAGQDGDAAWKLENNYMEVAPGTGNIKTRAEFGDCQLHLEFAAPEEVKGEGQGRGNSGVFMMGRYEIQVLDCYDNPTYADGATGGIYGQFPPLVNACRKPGEWSVYNIIWTGPRFDGETVVRKAQVTVMLNGIVVQNARVLQGPTEHLELATYKPHAAVGPLELQDHGDRVRFRNIWYRPL